MQEIFVDLWRSPAEQRGFRHFHGLAPVGPSTPRGEGAVIVPVEAKLSVSQPVLFAVTVEPPTGVVVSSRDRIVLVARPGETRAQLWRSRADSA